MDTFFLTVTACDRVFYKGRALQVVMPLEDDVRRAREAKERAQEQLRQKQSIQEYYMSQASLARAMSRLRYSTKDSINI